MQDVMVTVLCTTYNHEKYVRKCLDGFVMQECNFKYEVIVHDDASTDRTQDIIREYSEKYPNIIKPILQIENQYSQGISIAKNYFLPNISGKYIAWCEGDDFWTDSQKLQKQVDMMEKSDNCSLCVHTVQAVNEDGSVIDETYPHQICETKVFSSKEFLEIACPIYNFQTSSYFCVTDKYLEYLNNSPEFSKVVSVGDWPLLLYFASIGNIAFISDKMSCYRHNSVGSICTNWKKDYAGLKKLYLSMIEMIKLYDKYTEGKYSNICENFIENRRMLYYQCLISEGSYKEALGKEYRKYFKKESRKDQIVILSSVYAPFLNKIYLFLKK